MTRPTNVSKEQLRSMVERIERLDAAQQELGEDKREVYVEAKANGFNPKVIRRLVQLRKQDKTERQEEDALLDLYMHALGMAESGE